MICRSIEDSWYFTLTRESFYACVRAFRELAKDKCPQVVVHADSIRLDVAQIALALFPVFFMPFMPPPVALTVFDSICVEGPKVLVRFALNLILNFKNQLLRTRSAREFTILVSGLEQLSDVNSPKSFLDGSFSIYLSRGRHINKYERRILSQVIDPIDTPSFVEMIDLDVKSAFDNFRQHRLSSDSAISASLFSEKSEQQEKHEKHEKCDVLERSDSESHEASGSKSKSYDRKFCFAISGKEEFEPRMRQRSGSLKADFDREFAFDLLNANSPEGIEARQKRLNEQLIEKGFLKLTVEDC